MCTDLLLFYFMREKLPLITVALPILSLLFCFLFCFAHLLFSLSPISTAKFIRPTTYIKKNNPKEIPAIGLFKYPN